MLKYLIAMILAVAFAVANGASDVVIVGPDGKLTKVPKAKPLPPPPAGQGSGVIAMPPATNFEINGAALPKPAVGFSTMRVKPTTEVAPQSDSGAFRVVCPLSHIAFDDPIVYPGQPGRSHLHAFFGNTGINAHSTAESIRTTGNSTCHGGIINRSGYWVPATIDVDTGAPVLPDGAIFYYKTGYGYYNTAERRQLIMTPPAGLRMITGSPSTASATNAAGLWDCIRPGGATTRTRNIPGAECPDGSKIVAMIGFPDCWDGVNLDAPDHQSHMRHSGSQVCPASHPVRILNISINITYKVTAKSRPQRWRLVSDMYDLAQPGGWSFHADWFNGWMQEFLEGIRNNCVVPARDCHAHLLGDGRTIF